MTACKVLISAIFGVLLCLGYACRPDRKPTEDQRSGFLEAADTNLIAWGDQGDGTFANPLIWADYNNPFLLQSGDDYYMITASHHFMGMPVLHSRDLVNWKLVTRIYRRIGDIDKYNTPGLAYKHGSWAPSLTFHKGYYRMYVMNSTDGLFTSRARRPEGPWEPLQLIHSVQRWEDPYVFWDDDGEAYLFHSGKRVHPIMIHRMDTTGTRILDEGKVISGPNAHNPYLIKRNGYYYLFAADGETWKQEVYRATQILGPYEKQTILEKGGIGPSPGGGGLAVAPDGTEWYLHHVGIKGHGRMPFLEKLVWEDGWPKMGIDTDGNGIGEPGASFRKPIPSTDIQYFHFSDDFTDPDLKTEWLWNHNPDPKKFSTGDGRLTLRADTLYATEAIDGSFNPVTFGKEDLCRARNVLAFMPVGTYGQADVIMDVSGLVDDQRAGLAFFNQDYFWLGVLQSQGQKQLAYFTPDQINILAPVSNAQIRLRALVEQGTGRLAYSLDGKTYQIIPHRIDFDRQWFENHKIALFTYHPERPEGSVSFRQFRYRHLAGQMARGSAGDSSRD